MQSKKMSLLETWMSTVVGFGLSFLVQISIFPLYGIHIPLSSDFQIVVIFTVASILRGYCVRRYFNQFTYKEKQ